MTILVTGGAGFIGSNFIDYWMNKYSQEDKIICVDKQTYACNKDRVEYYRNLNDKNFLYANFDIADKNTMDWLFSNYSIDIVINFAAESHVDNSIVDASPFIRSNVDGVAVLLDMCVKYGVPRFHQVSTDEVYGSAILDRDFAFVETDMLNPSSPYSSSKAAAEMLCISYGKTHNLFVTISRCSNNYGKYQHEEKLIPKIITQFKKGKKVPIYGTGKNLRDWIHVLDHCAAIEDIIFSGCPGEIYNIGGDNEYSNLEIVAQIAKEMRVPIENCIDFISDRKAHDFRYSIDSTKIKTQLGWKPAINFHEGLKETIKWYIER